MMPVVFMPSWLQNIIAVLPLRYSYSLPAEVIQGKAVLTSGDVIYMTGSVIVLFGLCKVMWQRAQLKYSSAGG